MQESDEKAATLSIKKGITAVALGYRDPLRPNSPLSTRFRIQDTHPSTLGAAHLQFSPAKNHGDLLKEAKAAPKAR